MADGTKRQFGTLDVARMLGVSAMTVVRWIDKGIIPAFKTPGNHRRILREDLKHFIRKMDFPVPPELAGDRWRLLAVDDEADVLDVLVRAFDGPASPYEVFRAEDGVTALIDVGRLKPDVLLLDMVLPGLDGLEVCRRIKANPNLSTRIVAISGKATEEMKQAILAAGADLFFKKPVSIHALRSEVAKLLGGESGMAF
jgi:excisionase family DNA binding protein